MLSIDPAQITVICFCLAIAIIGLLFLVVLASNRRATPATRQSRFPFWHRRGSYRKNKEIGDKGEFRLWDIMETRLAKTPFRILHDIRIPIEDRTTQIDFLVVSCWGIFVIEVKTMRATISGTATDPEWTAYYDRAISFRNPLLQNQYHIDALCSCFGFDSQLDMKSIVAFSEEAVFQDPPPENVMFFQDVPDYILSHLGTPRFHFDVLTHIVDSILSCDPTITPETRDEHTTNIPLARLMRYYPPTHARTYP